MRRQLEVLHRVPQKKRSWSDQTHTVEEVQKEDSSEKEDAFIFSVLKNMCTEDQFEIFLKQNNLQFVQKEKAAS